MGTVYKPTFTKPLLANAELITSKGETFARVKAPKGRVVAYPVTTGKDGSQRIVVESGTYVAKYRDGSGLVHTVSTGCRDEGAARSVLNELERRSELVKAGVMTAGEDRIADHAATPIAEHFKAYMTHLQSQGVTAKHISETTRIVEGISQECGFTLLRDIQQDTFESWLAEKLNKGAGAKTRNTDLQSLRGFSRWCVKTHRFSTDPLRDVVKADEKSDRRRQRRAMTEAELVKLLHVARWRPLAEFGPESVKTDAEDVRSKRGT